MNKFWAKVFSFGFVSLYLFYHFFIDRFYCLSADDFSAIDYATKGIPGISYALRFYFNWEGHFLSKSVQGLLVWLFAKGVQPAFIFLLLKSAMLMATAALIKAVFKWLEQSLDWSICLFFATSINLTLYLISPSQPEIWHWLIGTSYLIPLVFLQMGLTFLLNRKFLFGVLAFAVLMQSRATYSVLSWGFICLFTGWLIYTKNKDRGKWLIISSVLLVFLLIYLFAPGNYVRHSPHGKSLGFLISSFKTGLHDLWVFYNIAKLDRVFLGLLASLPIVLSIAKGVKPKHGLTWLLPGGLYLGFTIVHEFLFVYITGYNEWPRVLSLHVFLFFAMSCTYGFWFYSCLPMPLRTKLRPLSVVGLIGLCYFSLKTYTLELQMAKEFKLEYDERMVNILEYTGTGDTLYLRPLNYKGVLYFEDFSENPDHWINYDFRKAYNLDFKVALDVEENHK